VFCPAATRDGWRSSDSHGEEGSRLIWSTRPAATRDGWWSSDSHGEEGSRLIWSARDARALAPTRLLPLSPLAAAAGFGSTGAGEVGGLLLLLQLLLVDLCSPETKTTAAVAWALEASPPLSSPTLSAIEGVGQREAGKPGGEDGGRAD
jgi:hypothetical protein